MRPDGSDSRQLTSDGGVKASVSWSPDGTRLIYARTDRAHTRIYVVGLGGAPPVALSAPDAYDYSPVWSPDGTKIAFSAPALTVVNADGSGRRTLTQIATAEPSWSPDGARIAFSGFRSFPEYTGRFGTPTREDVFVLGADGSGLRRLTGPFGDARLLGPGGSRPSWWPDGSRLLFVSQRDGPFTTFEMNADGSCQERFGPGGPALQGPVWQPGGGPLPPVTRCVELRVAVDAGKSPVALGEPTTFTVTVDNDGNLLAKQVTLAVTTPDDAELSSGSAGCRGSGVNLGCLFGGIAPGGSARFTVTGTRSTGGPVRLLVRVSGDELDTDPTNNDATAEAEVLACTIAGTYGNDTLYGTPGPDRICGLPGADAIYGGRGNDFVDAGNGDDRIYPGPGRDIVIARGGDDVIEARDGERDWIDCGAQHDVAVVDRIDVVRHCEVVARG
jgi:uncharacterized repeat protein (TIGR01451 family)